MTDIIKKIKEEKRWLNRCIGILTYHSLQQAQHENKRNKKWTVADSARELEMSIGYVSECIKLAKAADSFDFSQLTRDDALKLLKEKRYVG